MQNELLGWRVARDQVARGLQIVRRGRTSFCFLGCTVHDRSVPGTTYRGKRARTVNETMQGSKETYRTAPNVGSNTETIIALRVLHLM